MGIAWIQYIYKLHSKSEYWARIVIGYSNEMVN